MGHSRQSCPGKRPSGHNGLQLESWELKQNTENVFKPLRKNRLPVSFTLAPVAGFVVILFLFPLQFELAFLTRAETDVSRIIFPARNYWFSRVC